VSRLATLTAEREMDVELPESVRGRLAGLLANETIVHAVNSDMCLDGTYDSESWLVVTQERLIVLDKSHPNGLLMLPLEDLSSARVRQLYGNAVLELRLIADVPSDLLLQLTPSPIEEPESPGSDLAFESELPTGPSVDAFRFSRTLEETVDEVVEELVNRLIPAAQNREVTWQPKDSDDGLFGRRSKKGRCRGCGRVLPPGQSVCPRCLNKRQLLGRAFQYIRPYRWLFVANFTITALLTAVGLVPPLLTKTLIDDAIAPGNVVVLRQVIILLVMVHAFQSVGNAVHRYLLSLLGNRVVVDLRTEVYRQVQRLTLGFYDKRQTGWIMSRVTNDTSYLQGFLVNGIQDIAIHSLTLVGIAIIMFGVHCLSISSLARRAAERPSTSWWPSSRDWRRLGGYSPSRPQPSRDILVNSGGHQSTVMYSADADKMSGDRLHLLRPAAQNDHLHASMRIEMDMHRADNLLMMSMLH
jgi:hypothetical protein